MLANLTPGCEEIRFNLSRSYDDGNNTFTVLETGTEYIHVPGSAGDFVRLRVVQ